MRVRLGWQFVKTRVAKIISGKERYKIKLRIRSTDTPNLVTVDVTGARSDSNWMHPATLIPIFPSSFTIPIFLASLSLSLSFFLLYSAALHSSLSLSHPPYPLPLWQSVEAQAHFDSR